MYATGKGLTRDDGRAYMWFTVAMGNGVPTEGSVGRGRLEPLLTPEQRATAEAEANACRASRFLTCGEP